MIDENGRVFCENCGKNHDLKLEGKDYLHEWYCPKCHHFQREVRHVLDKSEVPVLSLNVG